MFTKYTIDLMQHYEIDFVWYQTKVETFKPTKSILTVGIKFNVTMIKERERVSERLKA